MTTPPIVLQPWRSRPSSSGADSTMDPSVNMSRSLTEAAGNISQEEQKRQSNQHERPKSRIALLAHPKHKPKEKIIIKPSRKGLERPHTTENVSYEHHFPTPIIPPHQPSQSSQQNMFSMTMDAASLPPPPLIPAVIATPAKSVVTIRPNTQKQSQPPQLSHFQKTTPITFTFDESKEATTTTSPTRTRPSTTFTIRPHHSKPSGFDPDAPIAITDSHIHRPSFTEELTSLAERAGKNTRINLSDPSTAQLSARMQQIAIQSLARPAEPASPPKSEAGSTLTPQTGSLRQHARRAGVLGTLNANTNLTAPVTTSGGPVQRGSVLLRADYLAELAQRSKIDASAEQESMAFRHSFLFSGNQKVIEAALRKEREVHRESESDSDEDDQSGADEIRPELGGLGLGVGFNNVGASQSGVAPPKLHPMSKQFLGLDPATIAADHTSLHQHLTTHDPIILEKDLTVVEHWLTEMAVKFQRRLEGEHSINNTSNAMITGADNAQQSLSMMATSTATAGAITSSIATTGGGDYQSPLDKMGLGRRLLEKAGMASDLIQRCYIGFFTYSIGFYDSIFQLVKHIAQRPKLLSLIWQTYLHALESSEPDMYDWVMECVRTENARREDLKRHEYQHRCQLLRTHTKHLKKKVKIMKINDTALQELETSEHQSIKNLGSNLRLMQHEHESALERKSAIHTAIAEWTMNSFEMESQVHHQQEYLTITLLGAHTATQTEMRELQENMKKLLALLAEDQSKRDWLQREFDTLTAQTNQLDGEMVHSSQHFAHLVENTSVYRHLIQEEQHRVNELEDIIRAQELYIIFLGKEGIHADLSAQAQDIALKKLQMDAARERAHRPRSAAKMDGNQPSSSPSTSSAVHDFSPQLAEMSRLKDESLKKTEEFKLEEAAVTQDLAKQRALQQKQQDEVESIRNEVAQLTQSYATETDELLLVESIYDTLTNRTYPELFQSYTTLESRLVQGERSLKQKKRLLEMNAKKLQESLHRINDLSKIEEDCTLEISTLNEKQHHATEKRVQLEAEVEGLSKTMAQKTAIWNELQLKAAPRYDEFLQRLTLLKRELEIQEQENREVHEPLMLRELKAKQQKEEEFEGLQTQIREQNQFLLAAAERVTTKNVDVLKSNDDCEKLQVEINTMNERISMEQHDVEHFHAVSDLELKDLQEQLERKKEILRLEIGLAEETAAEDKKITLAHITLEEENARKISDVRAAFQTKVKDMEAMKRKKEGEQQAQTYALESLKLQLTQAEAKLEAVETENRFLVKQKEEVTQDTFDEVMKLQLKQQTLERELQYSLELDQTVRPLKAQFDKLQQLRQEDQKELEDQLQFELQKSKRLHEAAANDAYEESERCSGFREKSVQAGRSDEKGALQKQMLLPTPLTPAVSVQSSSKPMGTKPTEYLMFPSSKLLEELKQVEMIDPLLDSDGTSEEYITRDIIPFQSLQLTVTEIVPVAPLPPSINTTITNDLAYICIDPHTDPSFHHTNGYESSPSSPKHFESLTTSTGRIMDSDAITTSSTSLFKLPHSHIRTASDSQLFNPIQVEELQAKLDEESNDDDEEEECEAEPQVKFVVVPSELYRETLEELTTKDVVYIYLSPNDDIVLEAGDELIEEEIGLNESRPSSSASNQSSESINPAAKSTSVRRFIRRPAPIASASQSSTPSDLASIHPNPIQPSSSHIRVLRFKPIFFQRPIESNTIATANASSTKSSLTQAPGSLLRGEHPDIAYFEFMKHIELRRRASLVPNNQIERFMNRRIRFLPVEGAASSSPQTLKPYYVISASPSTSRPSSAKSKKLSVKCSVCDPVSKSELFPKLSVLLRAQAATKAVAILLTAPPEEVEAPVSTRASTDESTEAEPEQEPSPEPDVASSTTPPLPVVVPQKARADNHHIAGWRASQLRQRFEARHAEWAARQDARRARHQERERRREEALAAGWGPEHDMFHELASSGESSESEPNFSSEEEYDSVTDDGDGAERATRRALALRPKKVKLRPQTNTAWTERASLHQPKVLSAAEREWELQWSRHEAKMKDLAERGLQPTQADQEEEAKLRASENLVKEGDETETAPEESQATTGSRKTFKKTGSSRKLLKRKKSVSALGGKKKEEQEDATALDPIEKRQHARKASVSKAKGKAVYGSPSVADKSSASPSPPPSMARRVSVLLTGGKPKVTKKVATPNDTSKSSLKFPSAATATPVSSIKKGVKFADESPPVVEPPATDPSDTEPESIDHESENEVELSLAEKQAAMSAISSKSFHLLKSSSVTDTNLLPTTTETSAPEVTTNTKQDEKVQSQSTDAAPTGTSKSTSKKSKKSKTDKKSRRRPSVGGAEAPTEEIAVLDNPATTDKPATSFRKAVKPPRVIPPKPTEVTDPTIQRLDITAWSTQDSPHLPGITDMFDETVGGGSEFILTQMDTANPPTSNIPAQTPSLPSIPITSGLPPTFQTPVTPQAIHDATELEENPHQVEEKQQTSNLSPKSKTTRLKAQPQRYLSRLEKAAAKLAVSQLPPSTTSINSVTTTLTKQVAPSSSIASGLSSSSSTVQHMATPKRPIPPQVEAYAADVVNKNQSLVGLAMAMATAASSQQSNTVASRSPSHSPLRNSGQASHPGSTRTVARKIAVPSYEYEDANMDNISFSTSHPPSYGQRPSELILFDEPFFERTHAAAVEAKARESAQFQAALQKVLAVSSSSAMTPFPPNSAAPSRPRSRGRSRTQSRSQSRAHLDEEELLDGNQWHGETNWPSSTRSGRASHSNSPQRGGGDPSNQHVSPQRSIEPLDIPLVQGLPPPTTDTQGLQSPSHAPEREAPSFHMTQPAFDIHLTRAIKAGSSNHFGRGRSARAIHRSVAMTAVEAALPFRPTTAPDASAPVMSGSQSARATTANTTAIRPTSTAPTGSSTSRPVTSWKSLKPAWPGMTHTQDLSARTKSRLGAASSLSMRSTVSLKHPYTGNARVPEFIKKTMYDRPDA